MTALTMLLYMGAYIHCLHTDKDALRSESYSIQKLAIQKGFVGDSTAGIFKLQEPPVPNGEAATDATTGEKE